ncbi:MAG: hypothetical protein V4685_09350 [Bacteroidota bacterium]
MKYFPSLTLLLFTLMLFANKSYCQTDISDTLSKRFTRFIGEWRLKDNVWRSKLGGESKDSTRSFVAKAASPENSIIWSADFGGGGWAVLFWTYHKETGKLNHISNTTDNNVGIGTGEFNADNDLIIKIVYPNGCTTCHRIYTYHWISSNEFDFKATIYKDGELTDDFYGATFLRK